MRASTVIVALCFAVLLGVPLVFRPAGESILGGEERVSGRRPLELIIITPHNEQIRYEFARGFDDWHRRTHGQPVNVIWNVPGGTTEIRRMLEAQFSASLENHQAPGGNADLVFGGGTREHGRLKTGVRISSSDGERWEPISQPVDFSNEFLDATYGDNHIGDGALYDNDKHWLGLALSGFGVVFNRDALRELNVDEPAVWSDLCHPRLRGAVALVNPGQSGSIATAFEAILKREGWARGWQILRRAGANARYFSGSALKPPIDVSQGSAAVGVCIDFFGRYQSQALREAGDADRVGYIDPRGGSTIDADPISMLRNAPHPEVARRFIEFCLSDEGQALWQFPRRSDGDADAMGPVRFELRRLPARRSMYQDHFDTFIDKVNPFELATPVEHPDPNVRDFIAPMFAAIAMDTHDELRRAWETIVTHPAYPDYPGIVTADDVSDPTLKRMLALFDDLPSVAGPDSAQLSLADVKNLGPVRQGWLRGGWSGAGLWDDQSSAADAMRREFVKFFREKYRQIVELDRTHG
jgi:iron(III) transport system substrate-binding protein